MSCGPPAADPPSPRYARFDFRRLRSEGAENGCRALDAVAQGAPEWRALEELARTSSDPVPLVRDALVDVEGILAAFVFGSVAQGTQREDSDIDLFVLEGPGFDRRRFYRQLSEVSLLLAREVNAMRYTPQDVGERLGDPSCPSWGFLDGVLTSEKIWIAGSPSALAPIAAAAGIPRDDLSGRAA